MDHLVAKPSASNGLASPIPQIVKSGFWLDPYSGKFFSKASKLDIDHIVPLKNAYEFGAEIWSKKSKRKFGGINKLNYNQAKNVRSRKINYLLLHLYSWFLQ